MKQIAEDESGGLLGLMGETITCLCVNYFYTGKLTGLYNNYIELSEPSIVYQTGNWSDKGWEDAQKLPCDTIYVMKSAIESFGILK